MHKKLLQQAIIFLALIESYISSTKKTTVRLGITTDRTKLPSYYPVGPPKYLSGQN